MSARPTPAYDHLTATWARLHRLQHLQSIAQWDQASQMPPAGNAARGEALAELATLLHTQRTAASVRDAIERAADEDLDDDQHANLREIRRDWFRASALPAALVERKSLLGSHCEHAWRRQRPANDWAGFLANWRPVVEASREEAQRLAELTGEAPYDCLMDRYEPGLRMAQVDDVFDPLRQWLPPLIRRVQAHQDAQPPVTPFQGPFDRAAQRRLCERVMGLLQFDFSAGRLDVSTHPFCGGVPEDVRLTTRFRDDEFIQSLMGTVHETGHGRYEQNLPRALLGQPVALARSMAIHESQSLSFELQIGSHPGFLRLIAPWIAEAFGPQPAFAPDNLVRVLNRVQPSFIRVDADEVTYPAHVLLRYDIERGLFDGSLQPEDVPAAWDEAMQDLLGVDTRGNYRDGPLQDVHWTDGAFGYFPCYTLGAMYAAQWFAAIRRERPGLDAEIAAGELDGIFDWLRTRIWQQASRHETDVLTRLASGEPLNPAHFKAHLEARYLG